MRIFISAGEPSGDLHAGNLVHSLRKRMPEAEFVGFGGPNLARAGAKLLYPLTDLAVMWFGQVFRNLGTFVKLANDADRFFRVEKPDAVVLVDYPGFHWHLAKRAKRRGIPVFYYVPPQIWAWADWRVAKMRRFVDHVLCSLPFEPDWYRERGVENADYVGHPFFDEIANRPLDEDFLDAERSQDGPIVAILPGSRTLEIERNFPWMLQAAAKVAAERPDVRFAVACLREKHQEQVNQLIASSRVELERLRVHVDKTAELIRLAELAWSVSGSVSLELMAEALPTVILYKIRPFDLWISRPFIKARFITLVNLLADEELMPEYLTDGDASPDLAAWALRWLNDPAERAKASRKLAELRDRVAVPGASERAADRISAVLGGRSAIYQGPHDPSESPDSLNDDQTSQGWLDWGV